MVPRVQLELPDPPVLRVILVQPVRQEAQALRDLQEQRVQQGLLGRQEEQGLQDQQAQRVLQVLLAQLDQREQQVLMGLLERLEQQV